MEHHYKVLGLSRNATKEEIKEAFRKAAIKFHPDKHSGAPDSVREAAIVRFKQASEAYEFLMDDSKRGFYNGGRRGGFNSAAYGAYSGYNANPNSGYSYYGYNNRSRGRAAYGYGGFMSKLEIALRFLTTRSFLLHVAFAGALLGGGVIIERSGGALWKMQNPGKSFEDAMETVKKSKTAKDKM
ncbi:chaperone protein dnaJ 72 [Diospyros lotus]|uniref:chaperone protein dnaJ 72 n=1 Tax=Diospyros lotus TaxID=55363 RepID=UPI002257C2BF|nr:chaperone protein dnaJ 72 [Diospyros lotus]